MEILVILPLGNKDGVEVINGKVVDFRKIKYIFTK